MSKTDLSTLSHSSINDLSKSVRLKSKKLSLQDFQLGKKLG